MSGGQVPDVRSARPSLIMVQQVLVFIIARRGTGRLDCYGFAFPLVVGEKFADLEDPSGRSALRESGRVVDGERATDPGRSPGGDRTDLPPVGLGTARGEDDVVRADSSDRLGERDRIGRLPRVRRDGAARIELDLEDELRQEAPRLA